VATRVDFMDRDRAVVHDATYTTCTREDFAAWQPDWILRAERLELDQVEDIGVARGAVLEFKGVPILPVPYISFPLSDKRKSGCCHPPWASTASTVWSIPSPITGTLHPTVTRRWKLP
jgi:LPS-assembly protein